MNGIILNSYHKSKQNDLPSSPVDENVGASENFWEFENAFSESGMKHKSVSQFDFHSFFFFFSNTMLKL